MNDSFNIKNEIYNYLNKFRKKFLNSFAEIINFTLKRKWYVTILMYFLSIVIGYYGFNELLSTDNSQITDEPFYGIWGGALWWSLINSVIGSTDDLKNWQIVLSQALAYLSFTFVIIFVLLKDLVNNLKIFAVSREKHSLVIGLGYNNTQYLESELKDNKQTETIIIEPDEKNSNIEYFRDLGFGVFVGTLDMYLKNKLYISSKNGRIFKESYFENLDKIVISTGKDKVNAEIATKIAGYTPDEVEFEKVKRLKIYMHIENSDYNSVFHEISFKEKQLEFIPFSFNDDIVRKMFEDHLILGNFYKKVSTNEEFSLAIVGSGNLAERLIYHTCLQSVLPNNNKFKIYCIDSNIDAFFEKVKSKYTGIDKINHVTFELINLNYEELEFYNFFNNKLKEKESLTNVYVCFEDENKNLECSVNLFDNVYRKTLNTEGKLDNTENTTKILFGIFNDMEFSEKIDSNIEEFINFYSFGNYSKSFLLHDKYEVIAKKIHSSYIKNLDYTIQPKDDDDKWNNLKDFHKKQSNRSQALHINSKLLSMGFKKNACTTIDKQKLRDNNLEKFKKHKNNFGFTDEFLKNLKPHASYESLSESEILKIKADLEDLFKKVTTSYDLISKLINSEHERWNTFHYLEGWEFGVRNDASKNHNCLKPLVSFDVFENEIETIAYDLYAIYNIPIYLADAGYEIVPID